MRQQLVLWGLPLHRLMMLGAEMSGMSELDEEERTDKIIKNMTSEVPYKGDASTPCSICFEDFKKSQVLREINHCKHQFHQKCIEEWIRRKGVEANCPLCKHDLAAGQLNSSEGDISD